MTLFRDVIIICMAVFCWWSWDNSKHADAQRDAALATVAGMEAKLKAAEDRAIRDAQLNQGGDDEALSDYGRDAAGILWPSD